jgi:hypothetical protein
MKIMTIIKLGMLFALVPAMLGSLAAVVWILVIE